MRKVAIGLRDRGYAILINRGLIKNPARLISHAVPKRRHALIVSQKGIYDIYGDGLSASLRSEGLNPVSFISPNAKSSEATKSQAVFLALLKRMAQEDGEGKSPFLIALGGGVVGDLTGFAASVYRRGIPYIQIPTTLTAQVDSAIGGKTGIDLPEGKNLLGSIYQPSLVICDPDTLGSLSERHWSDGFAEIIKYGVIRDPKLFSELESSNLMTLRGNPHAMERIIATCAAIKASVVTQDEFDKKDLRIILNFGHTIGHGIEAAAKYSGRYTHGEAVGIGMLAACDISASLGVLEDGQLSSKIEKTLIRFGLPIYHKGLSSETILKAIGYDKKSVGGKNRFVLPVRLGRVRVTADVPLNLVAKAVEKRKG